MYLRYWPRPEDASSQRLTQGRKKAHGFYQWTSQSSPLLDWICASALGLEDGQVTTYDPIKANWILDAPLEFRLGLVQGLAESDGSVSIAGQEVEFWIGPNCDLMISFLQTFGLHAFKSREAVTLSKSQAIAAYGVPVFSPFLRTVRYQRLEKLALASRPARTDRLPFELREEIMSLRRQGLSIPRIIETIVERRNLLISYEAAKRWADKSG